jgi:hypothetical protein
MNEVPDKVSRCEVIGDVGQRLAGVSTLAMACFLEGVVPTDLPLTKLQVERVTDELSLIGRESPLVAYQFCLARLSVGPQEQEAGV